MANAAPPSFDPRRHTGAIATDHSLHHDPAISPARQIVESSDRPVLPGSNSNGQLEPEKTLTMPMGVTFPSLATHLAEGSHTGQVPFAAVRRPVAKEGRNRMMRPPLSYR